MLGATFFNLFMFSVGMKVGPQFLSGLRRGAIGFVVIGLFVPFASLALMYAFDAIHPLERGLMPGIFAGANTATPALAAATTAYESVSRGPSREAVGNLSTAFAFSYCISLTLLIVMLKVLPKIFGRDAAADARSFESSMGASSSAPLPGTPLGLAPQNMPVDVRAYRLERGPLIGATVGALREKHPRLTIERVQRGDDVIEARDDIVLERGDILALYSRIEWLLAAAADIGPEVDAPALRDVGAETAEVVVRKDGAVGKKLIDVARDAGHGLYLNALFHGGELIPHGTETVFAKGDVLRVTGSPARIAQLEKTMGRVVRASMTTDIVTVALGLALGAFIGSITIAIHGVSLSLSSAVGLLLVGIALSTLRTRYPALGGPFPEPARQLLEDLGLTIFVAVLGLNSGAGVLRAMQTGALLPIIIGCLIVGLVPAIVAWVLGLYVMKMNSALLLGAVAGARCNSAGMRAGQEATKSGVPAIAYPITFAISNVLFTLMTYIVARLD
jgi:putative transport protein